MKAETMTKGSMNSFNCLKKEPETSLRKRHSTINEKVENIANSTIYNSPVEDPRTNSEIMRDIAVASIVIGIIVTVNVYVRPIILGW